MEVICHELPPIGTNVYLLVDADRAECAVVDAPLNAFATVETLLVRRGLKLVALLMTHGHWDHMLDGARFNEFGTPVYAHAADRFMFETPESMAAYSIPGLRMPAMKIDHWVEDGQRIEVMGRQVEVRHVPGHSPGSVLFWFEADGVAFCGDAVFRGSVGRTDLPLGSFEALESAIRQRIYTLPAATRLYPGHGPHTRVADEAANNPFVRA